MQNRLRLVYLAYAKVLQVWKCQQKQAHKKDKFIDALRKIYDISYIHIFYIFYRVYRKYCHAASELLISSLFLFDFRKMLTEQTNK